MDKPIPRNGLHTDLAYNSTHNNPAITMCSENSLVKRALQMLRFKLVDYSTAYQGSLRGHRWVASGWEREMSNGPKTAGADGEIHYPGCSELFA